MISTFEKTRQKDEITIFSKVKRFHETFLGGYGYSNIFLGTHGM